MEPDGGGLSSDQPVTNWRVAASGADAGRDRCWSVASRLRRGVAEPVLEARRADARVVAGDEGSIVQFCAEISGMNCCDPLPCVALRAQVPPDEFVEAEAIRAGQL